MKAPGTHVPCGFIASDVVQRIHNNKDIRIESFVGTFLLIESIAETKPMFRDKNLIPMVSILFASALAAVRSLKFC